jgi:hypothetical protein
MRIKLHKFNFVSLPELNFDLESVTTEKGRSYWTPNGKRYPSITTVLSSMNKDSILEWRKKVGEEEANKITRRASSRGTKIHKICEDYILGTLNESRMMPNLKQLFIQLKPEINKNIGSVYAMEQALYSHKLRVAGRCDCIAEWEGELAIVDYKTSSKNKKEEYILNYFLQCTAYSEMFEEITSIPINKIVVLISVEEGNKALIFEKNKNDYLHTLKEKIDEYYAK